MLERKGNERGKTKLLQAVLIALLAVVGWLVLPPLADLRVYGDGSFHGCVVVMACRGD